MKYYPRKQLASDLAQALLGKTVFDDAPNGLFLAAPRRTGKSTFLQADLKSALEAQGVLVVYVDLWSDQRSDPAVLIANSIKQALLSKSGVVSKAAKAVGLDSITLAGAFKMDLSKLGKTDGLTLTEALTLLHETAKAPIALIIDEAQHALTSEAGESAMAALKSARDQLNKPGEVNLMLVMSGSDRDKLLRLVNANGAAFYGSQIKRMPELGADFIAHAAELIEVQRPDLKPVDATQLFEAFKQFGHRPQFFIDAVGQSLNPVAETQGRFELSVLQAATQRQQDDETQMASDYLALSKLEQAVLWRMLAQGAKFRPYDAASLRFYIEKAGTKATPAKVQNALESLRNRQPSMIWKSARSEYAVDDAAMNRWYEAHVKAGTWPPKDAVEWAE